MTPFSTRVIVLFALAATIPVALTAIVWLAVSGWGAGATASEAKLAKTRIEELDAQRGAALRRLCRDDLAVDTLLHDRAREAPTELERENGDAAATAPTGAIGASSVVPAPPENLHRRVPLGP